MQATIVKESRNGKEYKIVNGVAYSAKTPDEVIKVLDRYAGRDVRIRVFYGDAETGRDWMEEYNTIGYIGRSTGQYKIPLMIANSRSYGGPALLDDCIVRITVDKRDVYRHPKYHQPEMQIVERGGEYPFRVEGKNPNDRNYLEMAGFKTRKQAERWISFMKGERNSK